MLCHSIFCLVISFLLQTGSIRVQLFNSSSKVTNIYYCKDIRSCSSFDRNQLLFRTAVTINGSKQNRWYLEKFLSSQDNEIKSRRMRVLGAIELSPFPNLLLKPWKRILENGSTEDAPEIYMNVMGKNTSLHFFNRILSLYHEISLVPNTDQSIIISSIREATSNLSITFSLRSLLQCDEFLLMKSFVSAGICYRKFLTRNEESELDAEGAKLYTHLLWRAVRFMFLLGEPPHILAQLVIVSYRSLNYINELGDSEEYPFYAEKFDATNNLFCFYFGSLYNNIQFSLKESEILVINDLNEFADLELYHWPIALEYLTKLQTVTTLMRTYINKQYSMINLFASMGNYAIQSGAVEQAVSFLCAGIEHSLEQSSFEHTPVNVTSFQRKSLESYILRLQHYLTKNDLSRQFLLSDSDNLQSFLSILTQAGMPVVLTVDSLSQNSWWQTAISLRKVVIDTLEELQQICKSEKYAKCFLNVHHRGAGVRGLFLAAYQGISLVEKLQLPLTMDVPARYLVDTTLPMVYYEFLDSVKIGNEIVASFVDDTVSTYFKPRSETEIDSKKKSISIVFICYSLSRHSVGRLLAKLIKHVINLRHSDNSSIFDVFIITDRYHPMESQVQSIGSAKAPDEIFLDIASLFSPFAGKWLTLPAFDFTPKRMSEVFNRTHGDDNHSTLFDIAVFSDLLMQSSQCIWAHEVRIAEHQILFWGHPQTSGMSKTMDYYITSSSFEEEQSTSYSRTVTLRHAQFVEQLVQFDSLSFVLYDPEPVAITLPGEAQTDISITFDRNGFLIWLRMHSESLSDSYSSLESKSYRIYGCIQTLMKHHPLLDQMLFSLLVRDPQAIVILLKGSKSQSHWFLRFQMRLKKYFIAMQHSMELEQHTNIDIHDILTRIRWIDPMPHQQYARLICHLHVNLDTFIFGGGVTLCDGIAGACPIDIENEANTDVHVDNNGIETFHSVGFVTAGILQTVHHIGAGIASHINDSSLAVNIPVCEKKTLEYHGTQLLNSIITTYVDEAIRLAKEAEIRRYNMSNPTKSSAANWKGRRNRIDELIFRNKKALDEYVDFFQRLVY